MGNKGSALLQHKVDEEVQIFSREKNEWLDGTIIKVLQKPARYEIEYTTKDGKKRKKNVLVENETDVLRKRQVQQSTHKESDKWGLGSEEMEERPVYKRGDRVMTKNGLGTVESVSGDGRIWVRIGQKTLKKYKPKDLKPATAEQIQAAETEAIKSVAEESLPASGGRRSTRSSQAPKMTPKSPPTPGGRRGAVRQKSAPNPSNRQQSLAKHGLTARPLSRYATTNSAYTNRTSTNMASVNDILPPSTPAHTWGAQDVERWAKVTFQGTSVAFLLCQFVKDGRTLVGLTNSDLARGGIRNSNEQRDVLTAIGKIRGSTGAKKLSMDETAGPQLDMFQEFGKDDFPDLPDEF